MNSIVDRLAAREAWLAHPDTYLAGVIRFRLGWKTFQIWRWAQRHHRDDVRMEIEARAREVFDLHTTFGGELQRPAEVRSTKSQAVIAKIRGRWGASYEQHYFTTTEKARAYAIGHGGTQTQRLKRLRGALMTQRATQRGKTLSVAVTFVMFAAFAFLTGFENDSPHLVGSVINQLSDWAPAVVLQFLQEHFIDAGFVVTMAGAVLSRIYIPRALGILAHVRYNADPTRDRDHAYLTRAA